MSRIFVEAWWPLPLIALAIPLLWWIAHRSQTAIAPRHRRWLTGLRFAAVAAAAIALMRPVWVAPGGDISVVYALDVSRSVAPGFLEAAIHWMERADADHRPAQSQVLAFADRGRFVDSPAAIRQLRVREGDGATLDVGVTDLESALDAARYGFAPNAVKRLVLMTDGNATTGDVWRAVDRLQRDGVRVFTVPALVREGRDAWIERIDVASDPRRDEPTEIVVRAFSQGPMRAQLHLSLAGRVIARQAVDLVAGANALVFVVRLPEAGSTALTAELVAEGDTVRENNRYTRSITVQSRPRVLYVASATEPVRYLPDALQRQGIDVTVTTAARLPANVDGLQSYGAVILSDVPGNAVSAAQGAALAAYVRDFGGGLLFAAGAQVYGDEGWRGSPVERALPVTFEAREKPRDLALLVVLDRSYSMKGRKMDLAKAATVGALDLLEPQQRFGVITFNSQHEVPIPLALAADKKAMEALIARFTASGQTNIFPALQTAYRLLSESPSKSRHIILLSDGDTQAADFPKLLRRMEEAQITLSAVAIGAEADVVLMQRLADLGKGRYYFTTDADEIPKIFVDETRRVANESVTDESTRAVVAGKAEVLRGVDFAGAPPLAGFIETKPRDRAERLLDTDTGVPLLARWQYGLGKTAVFASDVKNQWGAAWIAWPGYGRLFGQLVRDTLRRDAGEGLDFAVSVADGEAVVQLTVLEADGAFRNGAEPKVRITVPGRTPRDVPLRQTGPGRYEVRVPYQAAGAAPWRFDLAPSPGISRALVDQAGPRELHRPVSAEFRLLPPDQSLLRAIATQTGGAFAPEPAAVFADLGDTASRSRPLWPWFAAAALMLYLLDLALRRTPWGWRRLAD
ncbi:MAG: VWA domain-containing protein, partial [Burkholderiales bacterium]|nr:VWA domain-containing protein [Burkholderiales bacterium]